MTPLLALIKASESKEWLKLRELLDFVGLKNKQVKSIYQPLVKLGLVDIRYKESDTSQFSSVEVKISTAVHHTDNLFNRDLIGVIFNDLLEVNARHHSVSCLAVLFLLAVKVFKISDSKEVSRFIGNDSRARNACSKMITIFDASGITQSLKTDTYQNAPVHIFEVDGT
jgi:hypothetical protein